MIYDVLLDSLSRNGRGITTKWVRGIEAESLAEATRKAEAMHPDLGLTPTTTSCAWYVWPQPERVSE